MTQESLRQNPIVLIIDFHHARGPEIELCLSDDGSDPVDENDWSLLPFMALSDGAHASTEDFSYFTLLRNKTATQPATSLFGISCTRQMDANALINRPPDVTRSTVQKAVVVVTDGPQHFGQFREKLSIVTLAWFAQRDFTDIDILKKFREGLIVSLSNDEAHKDQSLGLSLREMIHEFKHHTLVLFKCLLLQPKMLFFGSRCERLCMIQFSLISLIPGLIHHLQDCADPALDNYSQNTAKPSSLKTSERSSLLAYMGLPLQIFGKGSMFGPYTPLQQLDLLTDIGTKSYVVGSTNSLLLQQKDRYSDILINLDDGTVNITSPSLRNSLSLTAADRRWIDFLTQTVNDTWDEAHPQHPKTHGYLGSEEFIRLQFEEYLLALLSCVKYHEQTAPDNLGVNNEPGTKPKPSTHDIEGDPALEFNTEFLAHWQTTANYSLFKRLTSDALLFSIVEPRHPCAGGLTIDDIQRRLAQQVAELHLDERVREGREALNKHLASGQKKVSTVFNNIWADIESMRESQRKKNEEKAQTERTSPGKEQVVVSSSHSPRASLSMNSWFAGRKAPSVDLTHAQASVSVASQKAGAYISSWGSWASERRKEWQEKRTTISPPRHSTSTPITTEPNGATDKMEPDRGRQQSPHRGSEDSVGLGRSASRRKRWSVLRMMDRCDPQTAYRKDEINVEHGGDEGSLPKSAPPKTAPSIRTSSDTPTELVSMKTVLESPTGVRETENYDTTQNSEASIEVPESAVAGTGPEADGLPTEREGMFNENLAAPSHPRTPDAPEAKS
ncbi:hypothetical protein Egran_03138 [Elaphomyces granulatus]|uniref:UDENN domain-containing protein n=1 Tax=Elaphomyces granulatus TaxID=519963 RepID=A0A232LYB4_9EURO|nr:hypothetical protein Egran_03138 [Elaphomyces granulatus]